jgi:hypothetical protein
LASSEETIIHNGPPVAVVASLCRVIELPSDISRKIEWAERLLRELDERVREYAATEPVKLEARASEIVVGGLRAWSVWASVSTPPPVALSLLAGDVVQNTRGALDYLARALVRTTGGVPVDGPGGTQFPVMTKVPKKELSLAGCSDNDVLMKVASLQPYLVKEPHRHPLARLNALNNTNKHQSIPVLTGAGGVPAVVAIHDEDERPRGAVVPFARWFFDNDRLDPAMALFRPDETPVVRGSFDTVVSLEANAWLTVSMVDELDFYLRFVRDEVVPRFQDHFVSPWPSEVFASGPVIDPSASLPAFEPAELSQMMREMLGRVVGNDRKPRVHIVAFIPGVSAAMGYHTGGVPLAGPPASKFTPRW